MNGRRAVIGLSMLCALVFCAFAAPNAVALEETTAYTCIESPGKTGDFKDNHCTEKGTKGKEAFAHEAIATNLTTQATGTGVGNAVLSGTTGGIAAEIVCTGASSSGHVTNRTNGAKQMWIQGQKIVITYTGCTAPKPAKQECKVKSGEVKTAEVASTTLGKGMAAEFTPETGSVFTSITLEGCKTKELNQVYIFEGAVLAQINGSTLITTEAQTTTDNKLKFGGQKAGLTSTTTLVGKDDAAGDKVYKPLSATTTGT